MAYFGKRPKGIPAARTIAARSRFQSRAWGPSHASLSANRRVGNAARYAAYIACDSSPSGTPPPTASRGCSSSSGMARTPQRQRYREPSMPRGTSHVVGPGVQAAPLPAPLPLIA